eukprot:NODE_3813_length_402_cov_111.660057_g3375_i0.p4 GENE.NODE_3813_length_402_cov_111.660057_g3375_i0~~NODE_3813_length_402_cov_111.660057_g3375_i0.p4  ORF type:complete len:53 (-),score=2.83 NODE_3813_length_402_cov_111.660057_g3375_i0:81-239(-)
MPDADASIGAMGPSSDRNCAGFAIPSLPHGPGSPRLPKPRVRMKVPGSPRTA